MHQSGALLAMLAVHVALSVWVLVRLTDTNDPVILAGQLGLLGLLPVVLFLFVWAGFAWARWVLAALFALRGSVGALALVLLALLPFFASSPPVDPAGERLVNWGLQAVAYLGMAFVLVRGRA